MINICSLFIHLGRSYPIIVRREPHIQQMQDSLTLWKEDKDHFFPPSFTSFFLIYSLSHVESYSAIVLQPLSIFLLYILFSKLVTPAFVEFNQNFLLVMDVSYCPRLHVGQFECKILRQNWSNIDGDFHKGKRKKMGKK